MSLRESSFRVIDSGRRQEFLQRGYKERWIFPHRIYYLPKCGPDGYKLATRMLGRCDLEACWEVVLYADASAIADLPRDLFFDRDLVWHQQHFGRPGQIASANLVVRGDRMHSMVHISDVVQRIGRARSFKTRIENRFEGWAPMLVNAVFNFAREAGARTVAFATADLALRHTDPARHPQRELFERVYDRRLHDITEVARDGDWWIARVADHAARTVAPEAASETVGGGKTISICHDIERGLGHAAADPGRAAFADQHGDAYLDQMLAVERRHGVRATYNVVGCLLPSIRDRIESDGHALGFHSFDHRVTARRWPLRLGRSGAGRQLDRCRDVDYRIRGYRPPQSRWTRELTEERLCFHNFEWLASSQYSFQGLEEPVLTRRIVRIPIALDEFDVYRRRETYDSWQARVIDIVDRRPFSAISLHDCYGDFWLPHYDRLLSELCRRGVLRTFDDIANDVIVSSAAAPRAA